jgi:hypothetical protein
MSCLSGNIFLNPWTLNPEIVDCRVSGFGTLTIWGDWQELISKKNDLQHNWFTHLWMISHINTQHPAPSTWGSGVGKIFMDIWKVDSNIFEKCLFHLKYCPESWVLSSEPWQSTISGFRDQWNVQGFKYLCEFLASGLWASWVWVITTVVLMLSSGCHDSAPGTWHWHSGFRVHPTSAHLSI